MSDSEEGYDPNGLRTYDIEVPQSLVGLVIGIKGKTIKKVSQEASVDIHVRPHHDPMKVKTYQIFEIQGSKHNTGIALQLFREEFPIDRFPELSLRRVLSPYIQVPYLSYDYLSQLLLPEKGLFDVHISSVLDINHFFIQLPLHPSFKLLSQLDDYVSDLYSNSRKPDKFVIPPESYENLMCVVPLKNKWYRAVALHQNNASKQMFVKFVDYGGFSNILQDKLRFIIREDVLELPFQAIECRLADVQPYNGAIWTNEARICFQKICMKKIIKAQLIGHHCTDGLPYIRLFVKNDKNKRVPFGEYLIRKKYAKPWDASTCLFLDGTVVLPKDTYAERVQNKNQKAITPPSPQTNLTHVS
uniref:Tudor domain-containing protein n=1 Tax=Panagrolaimus sp. ES5 TaxID=591445 RepID=A0AC34GY68_9BILA